MQNICDGDGGGNENFEWENRKLNHYPDMVIGKEFGECPLRYQSTKGYEDKVSFGSVTFYIISAYTFGICHA